MDAARHRTSAVATALVVLLVAVGAAGCAGRGAAAPNPSTAAPEASAPLPPGPLLETDDLDELLPGLSADASLRPRWETRDQLWELQLLRSRCGTGATSSGASPPSPSGPVAVEHDAEQWWQGTSPQYATLDVLRWPAGEPSGPRGWLDDVIAAESACREALALPHRPGLDAGPEMAVVVRRWEQPVSAGGPGTTPPRLWQVGAFAVDGSTAIAVRVGAYSARTAQEAWARAQPGVSAVVARAAQRAAAPAPPPSSSS